jgi:hypothetical protein
MTQNSQKEDEPVQAGLKQGNPNRRCAYPGCTTTLSIYNSDFMCWVHADERTRARYDRVAAGRIGAYPRPARVEPAEPSTH